MGLTIRASSLVVKRYLTVTNWGVIFMETAILGGRRKFNFGQIDHLLLSPDHVLSFQVGQEVFKIQTRPNKAKHQATIEQLVRSVAGADQRSAGFPVTQPAGVL